tara:strand:- start:137 stop:658 length:522 start_codon:yes stop_codon:yes gene_type:complete
MNKKLKEKLRKYKWKYRILLIYADNSKNKLVKQTIKKYEKYEKKFHDRNIKIIKSYDKDNDFKIVLIGYDGKKKGKFNKLILTKIFKLVDDMPMSKKNNLSLYADYNKKTTIKGLGFKNKDKALHTLKVIKNKPLKYQISVVNTMIGRAKNHPHKNKDMKEAIKVFQKWKKNY